MYGPKENHALGEFWQLFLINFTPGFLGTSDIEYLHCHKIYLKSSDIS